jgi:hypothetical protein
MSMSRTAAATSSSRAAETEPAGPAIVRTERLWLASLVRSRRWTPGTDDTAPASRSTTSSRRPSDTFGTDSIRRSDRSSGSARIAAILPRRHGPRDAGDAVRASGSDVVDDRAG